MFKLDFSLVTENERRDYINNHDLSTLTPSQLELCANYILYGKDNKGKSEVDKKHIYINTKYNSYSKKAPESLDSLMENPNFDEGQLKKCNTHYKVVKPTIDRIKDANIPTMKEMWEGIDHLQHLLDANTGKIDDPKERKLNSDEIYKLKHMLIDIRRGQYYLKDIFCPPKPHPLNKFTYAPYEDSEELEWNDPNSNFGFAPLGLMGEYGLGRQIFEDVTEVSYVPDLYNHKAKVIVDFRNPKHVYNLLEFYEELVTASIDQPTSLLGWITKTLDYYIGRANLKEQHYVIIDMKKRKCSNRAITQRLNELFGLTHTENYISTIWTQKICKEIAAAAELHYKEFLVRDDENAWKKCNMCGKKKLRSADLFTRKAKSADGLSNRCKCCDRLVREGANGRR
jgi:hypothetical protein